MTMTNEDLENKIRGIASMKCELRDILNDLYAVMRRIDNHGQDMLSEEYPKYANDWERIRRI